MATKTRLIYCELCSKGRYVPWVDMCEACPDKVPRQPLGLPKLQDLIAEYGGFDMVPPKAWKEYEDAIAKWNEAYRNDGFGQPEKNGEDAF